MAISRQEVEHVALLSRLALDEVQTERVTRQLGVILDYVEKLKQLDTEDVEPLSHPLPLSNVFRADERADSLSREDALRNAPGRRKGFFEVPRIIQ